MNWRTFSIEAFPEFSIHWDRINQSHARSPILESRFFEQLLSVFTPQAPTLVAFDDDPPRASAAAILTRQRLGIWHTYQPSQAPLGALVTSSDNIGTGILGALPFPALLVGISQQDPKIVSRTLEDTLTRTLDYIETGRVTVTGSFDDYWSARGKNLRHNMKRQRNRLEREGVEVTLDAIRAPEAMADAVRDYGQLESKSWKAGGGTAIAPDNDQGRFYTDMLTAYAATGNATVYRYRYDGVTVAVDLCIHNDDCMIILKTTYDESIKTSSPAFLMRQEVFREIFTNGTPARIEFYGRAMDWHRKWTEEFRTLYHINHYRHPLLRRLHGDE